MPDTFLGLAVLILLLTPGVIFAIQADSRRPARELSALRELTTVAAVGAICDITVLVLFGFLHLLRPRITPDIGVMARVGLPYIRTHLISISWWLLGLLIASCLLAWLLGRYWPAVVAGNIVAGRINFTSAWWEVFHKYPDTQKYVGCELLDGSYLAGYLMRYSTEPDEIADRELVLASPITYMSPMAQESSVLSNVGAVSVKASQMRYMTVTYKVATATQRVTTPNERIKLHRKWTNEKTRGRIRHRRSRHRSLNDRLSVPDADAKYACAGCRRRGLWNGEYCPGCTTQIIVDARKHMTGRRHY